MIRNYRLFRALRVLLALGRIFPRYLFLIWAEHLGFSNSQSRWDRVHLSAAQEIRRLANSLAGGFVKAAQIAGARADVLPAPFIDELSEFHDDVMPRPFLTLKKQVEGDLGQSIEDVFCSFEMDPIGAASLAQVHRAQLHNGAWVAVKIQYPEIRTVMPLDLSSIRGVAKIIHVIQRRVDVRSLVVEVTRFIEMELDFFLEVRSTQRLGKILSKDKNCQVPHVYEEFCGDRLIVLEFLDGIQITHSQKWRAAGHTVADIARRVGDLYGAMIFEYGFFHGDPHPGNLLVMPDGRIGLLDFGLCKELPKGFARNVAEMFISAMIGDADASLEAAQALGFDATAIRADHLRSLVLMMIGDSDNDQRLIELLGESHVRKVPEDFALVLRTLVLLNGLSHQIAPGRRLVQAELIQHLAIGASQSDE